MIDTELAWTIILVGPIAWVVACASVAFFRRNVVWIVVFGTGFLAQFLGIEFWHQDRTNRLDYFILSTALAIVLSGLFLLGRSLFDRFENRFGRPN